MPKMRDVINAMNILNKSDPKVVQALAKDISLEKAAEHAENLEGKDWVEDNWAEGNVNKAPTREQIKVGPREASSGEGAERMIRDYSDTAPQHGITLTAEAMSRMLGPINSSMKSLASTMSSNTAVLMALLKAMGEEEEKDEKEEEEKEEGMKARKARKAAKVLKADADHEDEAEEESEEDEEESEEESEVVEINAAKCRDLLAKARRKLAQAKAMKDEAEEEREEGEDEEKCKAKLRKARALRKAAAKLLAKARTAAYAASSDELKKAVRLTITKADINVVQEEEEDEEEEEEEEGEEEETKAKAAAKGPDAKGNQADHADPESGNQDSEAVKALAQKVEKSLEGFSMLQTDVRGLMETIAGRSKNSPVVPNLAKAQVSAPDDLNVEISNMVEAGTLNDNDAFAARDILGKITLAKAGHLDKAVVHERLAQASPTVRSILNRVAV
jgi:hypothetical protein